MGSWAWVLRDFAQQPLAQIPASVAINDNVSLPAEVEVDVAPTTSVDPVEEVAPEVADPKKSGSSGSAQDSTKKTETPVEPGKKETEPVVTKPEDPWAEAFDPAKPRLAFEATAFLPVDASSLDSLPAAEAQLWFSEVPGSIHRFQDITVNDTQSRPRSFCKFDGLAKLRAPWTDDTVLRVSPYTIDTLKLHFWSGKEGVTLRFFRKLSPQVWAGFRSYRTGQDGKPNRMVLLGCDDARYQRSQTSTFEVRYQDGAVLLSRGDMLLLNIPLSTQPDEVFLEGSTYLRDFRTYRGSRFPTRDRDGHQSVLASTRPAKLTWKADLPEFANFEKDADAGTVTLNVAAQEKPGQPVTASLPVSGHRLSEVVFRVESIAPGTGVFLADETGTHRHRVAYLLEKNTSSVALGHLKYNETRSDVTYDPNTSPPPYAGKEQWIRIVSGFGSFKIYVSGDGEHWGRLGTTPIRSLPGDFAQIGLFAFVDAKEKSITLSHLEVRELTAITNLASRSSKDLVPTFDGLESMDLPSWQHHVAVSRPSQVEHSEWRRACAIQSLQNKVPRQLGEELLKGLIADSLDMPLLPDEQYDVLDQASLMLDLWDSRGTTYLQQYLKLAAQYGTPKTESLSLVTNRLYSSPVWTSVTTCPAPDEFVRQMLLDQTNRGQWLEVHNYYERIRFWYHNGIPNQNWTSRLPTSYQLLQWGETVAMQHLPDAMVKDRKPPAADSKHPLITQLSKEGYNVKAEFDSAVTGKAFEDACQIIATAGTSNLVGLLPDNDDPRLLVPLSGAIAWAMHQHEELSDTMNNKYGEVGLVRVQRAIKSADITAVQDATIQYYGTQASVHAHAWLGDQELSSGRFPTALEHYSQALVFADRGLREELQTRVRLAAALMGREVGEPAIAGVKFEEADLTADQFETLATELRTAHANDLTGQAALASSASSLAPKFPAPTEFNIQPRGFFEGEYGLRPEQIRTSELDWVARQMSVVWNSTLMLISNRFQLVAYDINTGAKKWEQKLGGEQGMTHFLTYVPMKPQMVGNRVFYRRITKSGPELTAVELSTGKLLWRQRPDAVRILSDPVLAQGKLLALTSQTTQGGVLQLRAVQINPETGELGTAVPLIQVTDLWGGYPPCQLIASGGRLVATVGGNCICFNPLGQTLWLRRQSWIPSRYDARQFEQYYQAPSISANRVFVTQPGMRAIECLDLLTGRVLWTKATPKIQRLLNVSDSRVIYENADGFVSLTASDGALNWQHKAADRLNGFVCSPESMLYSKVVEMGKDKGHACLVWVDALTGKEQSRHILTQKLDKDPRFGPLIATNTRLWGFWGIGPKDPKREILELQPKTALPGWAVASSDWKSWLPILPAHIETPSSSLFPEWQVAALSQPGDTGHRPDVHSEKDVFATLLPTPPATAAVKPPARTEYSWKASKYAVRYFREIEVPTDGTPRLSIRVGHDPQRSWELNVDVDGVEVLSKEVSDTTASKAWLNVDVPLKEFAGRKVVVTVTQKAVDPKNKTYAYLKYLKLLR
ncbi:MAG: hypothetical protein CMJ78_27270 [Planctomycetaceae bacterium]|nr:hypothetical protein [Planctomycetaceae bacterium]